MGVGVTVGVTVWVKFRVGVRFRLALLALEAAPTRCPVNQETASKANTIAPKTERLTFWPGLLIKILHLFSRVILI